MIVETKEELRKAIYNLKFSCSVRLKNRNDEWTRVPGGWIYSADYYGQFIQTFIPFNNEFKD